jgi:protein-tyrosine phosphatase
MFLLTAVCGLLACSVSPPPPLDASEPLAERDASGTLSVRWSKAPLGGRIPIYAGPSPAAIDRTRPLAELVDGRATLDALPFTGRPYLELAPPGTDPFILAERRLPLEGSDNFRDLGGYRTSDGRRVRWNRVYRSSSLADLTDADLEYLDALGIRLVCDFRSPAEREAAPDRLPTLNPPRVIQPAIYAIGVDPQEMQERILSGDLEGLDLAQLLVDANRAFVSEFADRYALMFEHLLEEKNLPAVVHCTGGKDRAGMASALILLALGVPEETVMRDYLLTNHYTHRRIEQSLQMIRVASLWRTDPEQVRILMRVEPRYLQAGLHALRQSHGSVDAYLEQALGMSAEKRARLRELLLD